MLPPPTPVKRIIRTPPSNTQKDNVLTLALHFFVFVFLGLTLLHNLVLDKSLSITMSMISGGSLAAVLLLRWLYLTRWQVISADVISCSLMMLAWLNSYSHLFLSNNVIQVTNIAFAVAASGYLIRSTLAWICLSTFIFSSWFFWLSYADFPEDWFHFSFALFLAMAFSIFLRVLRKLTDESREILETDRTLARNLLDQLPSFVLAIDAKGYVAEANSSLVAWLGVDYQDLIQDTQVEDVFVRISDEEGIDLNLRHALARVTKDISGIPETRIYEIESVGGKVLTGTLHPFFIRSAPGQELLVVSFTDLSDTINARNELQRSESFYRTTLQAIDDGIVVVDESGRIASINRSYEKMTGCSSKMAVGRPVDDIVSFKQDHHYSTFGNGFLVGAHGEELLVYRATFDIAEGAGNARGSVITFRDVRSQHDDEEEHLRLDRLSSLGVLAGGIAHDFNNLLLNIYGNLELATAESNQREVRNLLGDAAATIEVATGLTRQFLTFSKGSKPILEKLDLKALIEDVTRLALTGSSVTVSWDVSATSHVVDVDSGLMNQAFNNILLNARQAMKDSGKITISIGNESTNLIVKITDDGPGIEKHNLKHIFEPYYTSKQEGIGLGLATTHSIVAKHHGSIAAESEVGGGTTMVIRLPMSSMPVDEAIDTPDTASNNPPQKSLRVLIMDDDERVQRTLQRMIAKLGHVAIPSIDGEDMIQQYQTLLAKGSPPDCVVCDLTVVGGMGGTDATRILLKLDPQAKVIASSGYSPHSEMSSYEDLGFCAALPKPYKLVDLGKVLKKVCP